MAFLLIVGIALALTLGLLTLCDRRGVGAMWFVGAVLVAIAFVLALRFDDPTSEASSFALGVAASVPVLLIALVVTIARLRVRRSTTVMLGTLIGALSMAPSYMLGCFLAEGLPVGGCFF